jgi:hypothetical protein
MGQKKIKKFNELMDPELSIELGLHKHLVNKDDDDYFFSTKKVNKFYDEDIIKVKVYEVIFEGEELIFKTKITVHKTNFDIFIITDFKGNVEFATSKGKNYMDTFERVMRPEFEYFIDMFEDIYKDIVPYDFWQVKGSVN